MDDRNISKGVICEIEPAQYTVSATDRSEAWNINPAAPACYNINHLHQPWKKYGNKTNKNKTNKVEVEPLEFQLF
jgi:hypothetical protein